MNTVTEHTIDAKGKKLGRVASAAASVLMGKNLVTFVRHKTPVVKVTITNASKLSITEKRREKKIYTHYTGHVGGLRQEKLSSLVGRKGYKEILRHAVNGMLPKNKLRTGMMKRLIIVD